MAGHVHDDRHLGGWRLPARHGRGRLSLERRDGDPPVYLEIVPAFSPAWVKRLEGIGALPVSEAFRARLSAAPGSEQRRLAWRAAKSVAAEARRVGFAGIVLMGLKFETVAVNAGAR